MPALCLKGSRGRGISIWVALAVDMSGQLVISAAPKTVPEPAAPDSSDEDRQDTVGSKMHKDGRAIRFKCKFGASPETESMLEAAVQCGEDSDVEELTPEQEKLLQQGLTDREASARLVSSLGMATKQGPADPHFVQPSNMTVGPEVFWAPESFRGKNVRRSLAKESS
ncbi:unnamed protein product [Symbiodinium sp. CCMP2592]|nr:unnamed protein product [Symbiodinium sp. CCMP2592]